MSLNQMALIAAALLVIYITIIVVVLFMPRRNRDPHDGMAQGCLMIVILGLVLIGAVLAAGVALDLPLFVHIPFYITVYPTIMLVISLIVRQYKRWRWRE